MSEFKFETDSQTYPYCVEIVECLQRYGGKSRADALGLLNVYWKDEGSIMNNDFRLHEDPYYWAMAIIHDRVLGDNNANWAKDPRYWPPPKEFLDRWYKSGK